MNMRIRTGRVAAIAIVALGVMLAPASLANKGQAKAPPKPQVKQPAGAAPPLPNTPYKTTPKTRSQVSALKRKAVDAQTSRITEARQAMDSLVRTAKQVKAGSGTDLPSQPQEAGAFVRAVNRHANEVTTLKQLNETSLRDFAAQRNMRIVRKLPNTAPSAGPSSGSLAVPAAPVRGAKSWRPPGNSEPRAVVRKTQF
ncbi:MAG: hypothetical protein AB8G16_07695 [Gammaproteobacteria bacterium]